jgi:hypothetical protein
MRIRNPTNNKKNGSAQLRRRQQTSSRRRSYHYYNNYNCEIYLVLLIVFLIVWVMLIFLFMIQSSLRDYNSITNSNLVSSSNNNLSSYYYPSSTTKIFPTPNNNDKTNNNTNFVFSSSSSINNDNNTPDGGDNLKINSNNNNIIIGGLIKDGADIKIDTLKFLVQMSCLHNAKISILVSEHGKELESFYRNMVKDFYSKNLNMNMNSSSLSSSSHQQQPHHHQNQQYQQQAASASSTCLDSNNLHIITEEHNNDHHKRKNKNEKGRINRLTNLREWQRNNIRELQQSQMMNNNNYNYNYNNDDDDDDGTVIILDLDLIELPPVSQILKIHSLYMQQQNNRNDDDDDDDNDPSFDVICAAGVTLNKVDDGTQLRGGSKLVEGYYDSFATIFLPDTFNHALHLRKIKHLRPIEDKNLVMDSVSSRSKILQWIKDQGTSTSTSRRRRNNNNKNNKTDKDTDNDNYDEFIIMNPVPVKSCFGGLAIYRTSIYLDSRCKYTTNSNSNSNNNNIDETIVMNKYGNMKNEVCEHVRFHNCLYENNVTTKIAIQPDLRTRWH